MSAFLFIAADLLRTCSDHNMLHKGPRPPPHPPPTNARTPQALHPPCTRAHCLARSHTHPRTAPARARHALTATRPASSYARTPQAPPPPAARVRASPAPAPFETLSVGPASVFVYPPALPVTNVYGKVTLTAHKKALYCGRSTYADGDMVVGLASVYFQPAVITCALGDSWERSCV